MRRPGQEPRRTAMPGAACAGPRDGAAAEWEVQAAWRPVNGAAEHVDSLPVRHERSSQRILPEN
jgi:hypothetical protein